MGDQSKKGDLMKRVLFLAVFLIPGLCYGWGREGHVTIANVGSQLTRVGVPFWKVDSPRAKPSMAAQIFPALSAL